MGAKKVPVERFEVADIKDDSIAFGDWTFVKRILANNVKQAIAVGASFQNEGAELLLSVDFALCRHDSGPPSGRGVPTQIEMREKTDLADKNGVWLRVWGVHGAPCKQGRDGRKEDSTVVGP